MTAATNAAEVIDEGVGKVESLLDWFVDNRADLPIGLAVAAGIVAVMLGFRWVGGRMLAGDPDCTRWRGVIGRVLCKTTLFFMIATALDIVVTYAEVPERVGRLVDVLFIVAAAFQAAIWARELIIGTITRRVGEDPDTTIGNATSIIRVLVSVAVFALAIIVILENLGADVTALIAGLGIGGIAIGLAAQGIFADLFAALAILFDRPFRRGDTIRYEQSVGTVEKIGLKTTRLRSITGEVRVMSNRQLLDLEIHNLAGGISRTTYLAFGLVYQTPPDLLAQVSEMARSAVSQRSGCSLVRCEITGFGASSIDFEFIFEAASTDIAVVAADRTAVVIALMRAFALHGIEFAYPTQTTFTAGPDGRMVMPYAEHPVIVAARDAEIEGADADRKS